MCYYIKGITPIMPYLLCQCCPNVFHLAIKCAKFSIFVPKTKALYLRRMYY